MSLKPQDLAALLDEPACAHNKKAKSGCARPKPGATAGGCAFDGAQIALLPVADVAHIVHGPIACAGNSWDNRGTRSTGPTLFQLGLTTDLTEQDVIMGRGEKRLFHSIRQAIDTWHPAAVFVYNTCVPALTGDDLEAVCKAAQERWETPVVPIDAAGFYGTKNLGNRIAGEAMVRHVCGTREPDPVPDGIERPGFRVHDINLIGEFNIAGEFWQVLPLLDRLGLRVLCTLAGDARFREIQTMHRAEVNMLVCSKALINVARKLQERHGTPWFEGSFYGVRDVSQALRDFARLIGDPDLSARAETLIAEEEARIQAALAPWRARLSGRRALLYTGGVKSWSIVSALQDLGMTVVASGTRKSTEDDKARIRELMGEDAILIDDGNPRGLIDLARRERADLLIAGGRNMYTALKARIPFLDINQEREFGYAGYEGMLELARQLCLAIDSPIWPAMRQPAPWAAADSAAPASPDNDARRILPYPTRPRPETPPPGPEPIIEKRAKALSVSPLKASATLGAALAFLGFDRTIPMLHGSQGCSAFGKVFFVRHFREPIPLQTTAIDQISAIMGTGESLIEGLRTLCEKQAPDLIGVPTTSLTESQGADTALALREFRSRHPEHAAIPVVPVASPDFSGCLESGHAQAVRAILDSLVPPAAQAGTRPGRRPRQVNVLASAHLTPGDLEHLKELIADFGLEATLIPDLSGSLDGHLPERDYSALTIGGTRVAALATLGDAAATLVIGGALAGAADLLRTRTGVPDHRFPHLMGLEATDRLMLTLAAIAGGSVPGRPPIGGRRAAADPPAMGIAAPGPSHASGHYPVPERIARQRAQLQDAMLDTHFMLGTARIAIAADPDLLLGFERLLAGVGAATVAAVTPINAPALRGLRCERVKIGDLEDLEAAARTERANLLIANSHGARSAERLGIPLLRAGFPQYDLIGGYQRTWIGYRGARATLFDLANLLASRAPGHLPAYRSPLKQWPADERGNV